MEGSLALCFGHLVKHNSQQVSFFQVLPHLGLKHFKSFVCRQISGVNGYLLGNQALLVLLIKAFKQLRNVFFLDASGGMRVLVHPLLDALRRGR